MVVPGSNAATHGLKPGDVLLAYNGQDLIKQDDLKVVAEGGKPSRSKSGETAGRPPRTGPRQARRGVRSRGRHQRRSPQSRDRTRARGDPVGRRRLRSLARAPDTRSRQLARLFQADDRPPVLLGADASEPELDRLAASGELRRFGFIHLATHGVIDEGVPAGSAVILTQTGLPDPLEQALDTQAGLRRQALGPRNPARLGLERRTGHALGLRDRPGPRCRRRGVRRVHPGTVDLGRARASACRSGRSTTRRPPC